MKVSLQKLHRAEIIQLLQNAKKTIGFILDLVYTLTSDSTLKTAVVVKTRLKSTQRNRVKRLVRQAFIDLAPRINKGGQCIVIVKKTPVAGDVNVQRQMESLLEQAKFL